MTDRIQLDLTSFEKRMAGIEERMATMEAFLAQALVAVFRNEAIVGTLMEQLGDEKAKLLVEAVAGYITELNARHGGTGG